jgi:hypothetical protein
VSVAAARLLPSKYRTKRLRRESIMRSYPLFTALLIAQAASAQTPTPDTDIYLAPLRLRDGWVVIGTPRNITARAGYDNQPHFTADGRAILYSARIDNTQNDIFRYDLRTRKVTRLTQTPESEYSPTPAPGGFSVIRVERDSTQRLWRFNDAGQNPVPVLPAVKPVGYHAWIDPQHVALFVLGSPAKLQLGDLRSGRADVVAEYIGRAIQKIPRFAGVSYVQRQDDSTSWLRRIDKNGQIDAIAKLPPGGEYHAWTPKSALLATAGSKLLEWTPIDGGRWREIVDFESIGLRVSRISVSPQGNWLAIVAERAQIAGGNRE